ncbi:neural cell adhesion molecule L1-like protein isoform X1 [Tachyglossus aculeatus]|uniref:neural cell adhesion molecule L1-like protein isoform X1 n=1 Tax=Tachyglossus aculeatus TaxID=9261 RepID=UPI0018F685A1|nr:neural cell adhesion molecule L1-like protein isoform X1 [Tachyglossus aculeatus]XP_038627572.1 neural cell adhesion molecule L1-like protein isoform X1 [Tachyglossus aculeatus]XP_038627573.1 neural cell adhesion molecule L1-like protein isoform X1 [Tachyglossus aculeatus]XP_038627574.1 neural cell adhesion molecule L1-like protein isoform X1 [Tachyglossus aculeatus]
MEMLMNGRGCIICLLFFMGNLTIAAEMPAMEIEIPPRVEQVPTIIKQSTVQVAFPFDEYFSLVCEAKGNPEPSFHWTKNGNPIDLLSDQRIIVSNNSGTFRIPNEGNVADFQGKYRCFASNKLGTAVSEEIEFIVPSVPKFPKEKIDPLEVEEGDSIVLHCNPPKGIPPLHIYWMNIDLQHIPQDERVYMSHKGDLYFANVEENDSRSDYCCFAAFPRLRTIVQKMPMKLTVKSLKHANDSSSRNATGSKANSIKQRKPKMLLPPDTSGSHSSVTFLNGSTLLLECFAEGLPTPQITWKKLDGNLPKDREAQENFGKTLKIEQVSNTDEGTYLCSASNFMGSAKHEFHVTVEEPPRWTQKPKSGVYSIGSNAILRCEASGNPQPEIKWKRNGLPVNKENLVSSGQILPREISLTNLQLDQSAVYQCEASNKHGTILANANVDVLDIIPVMLTLDGENYAAVIGYSAFLHCGVFSSPPAQITWQREDSVTPLGGPRFFKSENGTLEIKHTTKEDSGSYNCLVTNAKGKTGVTAYLAIRDATKLRVSPKNPKVLKSHLLVLQCQIELDSHLKHSLKLSWTKDGNELETNGTEGDRIMIEMDTLSISNITLEDEGVYSCLASTSLDSVKADSHVIILDVPDSPDNLHLSEKQNRSVRLTWKAGNSHNSIINEFIIEYEGNKEDSEKWEELTTVPGNETTVILSLAPYVKYKFRVIAVNGVGRSQPSKPSEHHETPPAAPDKNPENIRVDASEPNEMIMKWEPLKPMEQNGPGLEYRVSWRRQGVETDWNEETVKKHVLVLKNTPTFAPYDIKVQAINQFGSGPEPQIATGYSGEDYPDAAPLNVAVNIINSTLINATWSKIPKERVHGHLKGYKISWWKTKTLLDERKHHQEKHFLVFLGDRDHGMVPGLEPYSEFHLSVLAFNSKGSGPESSPIIFQTPEGVPEQPTFLRILNFDKDAVTLSWGLPKKANGRLSGYVLQYQIINETYEVGALNDINITNPSTLSLRLSDLNSTTKYKFYLRACTSSGCGKPITEEGWTIGEGSKSTGKISEAVNPTQKIHPIEVLEPGTEHTVHLVTKNWVDNNSIFEDVIETKGRVYAGIYDGLSTQGWFIGLMCAIALLTLILLTICFVKRNKGGKYSVKEKEDLHPDPEVQSIKDETFGEYSDSDEKPLKGSLRSLTRDIQVTESADSLVDYGEGDHGQFNEDGSFIGAYTGCKEKGSVESNGSSTATFPLRA